jgi:hypothetical protein
MEKEDKELTQECQETIAMLEGLKEKLKNLSPTGIGLPLQKPKKPNKSDKQVQPTKPENKL